MTHKVLIIGSTGYIGGAIVKRLHNESDLESVSLVRPSSNNISNIKQFCDHIVRTETNSISKNDVLQALKRFKITSIIHVAWLRGYENTESDWIKMTDAVRELHQNIMQAVDEYNPKTLVLFTSGNFSLFPRNTSNRTISPSTSKECPVIPLNKFLVHESEEALSHLVKGNVFEDNLSQQYISRNYNVVIVYPCSIYGKSASGANGIWDDLIADLLSNPQQHLDDPLKDLWTSWIHVDDVAKGYMQIIRNYNLNGTNNCHYYLLGKDDLSVSGLAIMLAQNKHLRVICELEATKNVANIDWDTQYITKAFHFQYEHSIYDENELNEWCKVLQPLLTLSHPKMNDKKNIKSRL